MTLHAAPRGLETKSADVADAFDTFMTTFEAFRSANDEKLAQIERRLGADAVTTERVERISRALDEQKQALDNLALKRVRPALGDPAGRTGASEHKAAFDAYLRRGEETLTETWLYQFLPIRRTG